VKTDPRNERYQRQIILQGFGEEAQQKLLKSKVLVIGAGGLGCPALQYLAAIGIGHIGIVDEDVVSISNLHRQVLYTTADVGQLKTEAAKLRLGLMNDDVSISVYSKEISQTNALDLIKVYDIILDCTDNFKARYIINDACVLLKKPLVFGAVFQYEGQVAVFNSGEHAVNYRDLFPVSPTSDQALNCIEAGVYNITTGIIGTLQAGEAIKLITGLGNPLLNQLMTYNSLTSSFYTVALSKKNAQPINMPSSKEEFLCYDYDLFCGLNTYIKDEISASEFDDMLGRNNIQLIDIRNEDELPKVDELNALRIPLAALKENIHRLEKEKQIILFCHSGLRTQTALDILHDEFHLSNVSHLKGGIIKWLDYKSNKQ
jgi:adenylyltransferase/sulfurtransferase